MFPEKVNAEILRILNATLATKSFYFSLLAPNYRLYASHKNMINSVHLQSKTVQWKSDGKGLSLRPWWDITAILSRQWGERWPYALTHRRKLCKFIHSLFPILN